MCCVCTATHITPIPQVQISSLQEELAAAQNDNLVLRGQLEVANTTAAAAQQENARLRAETTRLRCDTWPVCSVGAA